LYCLIALLVAAGAPRGGEVAQAPTPSAGAALASPQPPAAAELVISAPVSGQALQGVVAVTGVTALPGYVSGELAYAIAGNPSQVWFPLVQNLAPVTNGPIYLWDTTALSDGQYLLRLVVTLSGGSQRSVTVTGLRIRNHTPVETDTPTPAPSATYVPEATLTATLIPVVPTPLPTNPAQLQRQDIWSGVGKGILVSVGMFALLGIYTGLARLLFRRPRR